MRSSFLRQLPFLVLLVLATGIAQLSLTTGHDWGDDFAAYLLQAQSLLEGRMAEEVEENRFTIERSPEMGPLAYPWGAPALLAPVLAVSGLDFLALKHVNLLCFALLLVVLWYGVGAVHAPPYRLLLVALVGLNPVLVGALDAVLSDIPFLLVSTLAIVLIGRRVRDGRREALDGLLLGAVLAFAVTLRSNGLLLVATLAAADLVALRASRDQWLRISLPYLVFTAIMAGLALLLPGSNASLLSLLFDYRLGAAFHVRYYATLPADLFGVSSAKSLLFGLSLPVAFAGLVRRARTDAHVAIYCGLTVALLLAWPFIDHRYLFPILPFYFSFFVSGLELVAGASQGLWRRVAVLAVASLALFLVFGFARAVIGEAAANLRAARVDPAPGPAQPTARELYAFVRGHVPADRVVVAHKPRAMRLFGLHRSFRTRKASELPVGGYYCHYLAAGNFVQLPGSELAAMVQSGRLEQVFENRQFRCYRIKPI